MANKIKITSKVNIFTFISDTKRADKLFPKHSNVSSYSIAESGITKTPFFALSKNRNEVDKKFWRNGILHESSVKSMLEGEHLYVHPGEVLINGELINVLPNTTEEFATISNLDSLIDLTTRTVSSTASRLAILSAYVYQRKKKNYKLLIAPKESPEYELAYPKYMGYSFGENLSDLQVNNSIVGNDNYIGFLRNNLHDGTTIDSLFTIVEGQQVSTTIESYAEKLGTSKGVPNEIYRTRYFPIATAVDPFDVGQTTIFTKSKYTNVIQAFRCVDSYIAAEQANRDAILDSEIPNYIYLDRFNGQIYFQRQTLKNLFFTDVDIMLNEKGIDVDGDLFEDNGFVRITPAPGSDGVNYLNTTSFVKFYKIGKNKVFFDVPGNYKEGSRIAPYSYVQMLTDQDEVYAYYGVCVGFEKEIPFTSSHSISEKIKPWIWSEQKTIAVLSRDKKNAYKIQLRALDIPYLRRGLVSNSFVYGPLGASQELVMLEGTVLDEDDSPVANQEVSIYLNSGVGLINGSTIATAISNDVGKFYATFDPNLDIVSWAIFHEYVTTRTGTATYFDLEGSNYPDSVSSDNTQKSIIYAILKDDGTVGTVGRNYTTAPSSHAGLPIAPRMGLLINPSLLSSKITSFGYTKGVVFYDFLKSNEINDYIGGKIYLSLKENLIDEVPTLEEEYTIKNIVSFPEAWEYYGSYDFFGEPRRKQTTFCIILENNTVLAYDYISKIRLLKKTDIEFSPNKINGRKAILVEDKYESPWRHPNSSTLNNPIKGPMMTDGYLAGSKKFYVNRILPQTSLLDPENPIAAYAIIPERTTSIIASTVSENETIYSNTVEFEIEINKRDSGVITNLLQTVKVPYGWRLKDNYTDDASTIGVNTFFTVNRVPSSSQSNPKIPLISYVSSNGINYVGETVDTEVKAYVNDSSNIKFKIDIPK